MFFSAFGMSARTSQLCNVNPHLHQIEPIGLSWLFQVDGDQSVVLSVLVGVEHCLGPLVGDVVVVGVELGDDLGQGELGVDPLLAGGLLLQVGEVEQVVLAVLGGEDKEVPEASLY